MKVCVDVILHATEDTAKVCNALSEVLGMPPEAFAVQNLSGHHGNPITILNGRLSGNDAVRFVERLMRFIPGDELAAIMTGLERVVAGHGLDLRFDKQELVGRRLVRHEKGSVRIRIQTVIYDKRKVISAYTDLLERALRHQSDTN